MKRLFIILFAALAFICLSAGKDSYAVSYEAPISSLNHNKAYTWGLNLSIGEDETITEASLTLEGINNWDALELDFLYAHLLDTAPKIGITTHNNDGDGDYFSGKGVDLFTYSDNDQYKPNGSKKWVNPEDTMTYSFSSSDLGYLTSYLSDGIVGLGLDPDCHYYFKQIIFKVETETGGGGSGEEEQPQQPSSVPEPGTLLLLGSGLVGLALFRRHTSKK